MSQPVSDSSAPAQVGGPSDTLAAAEERLTHVTRNSTVMAIGTMGSRVLGFVRTALFAAIAGTEIAADAFTQANNLPTIIYTVIATGVVTGVLIPQITKAMKRPDGGDDFINRLITLALLVIGLVAVICTVGAPVLIGVTLANVANAAVPGYLHLAVLLGFWCMPQIFFYGLYAVLGQVLNARGHFMAFAWAPALANVIQIAGLVWFLAQWGQQDVPSAWTMSMVIVLGGSTTAGIAVQAVCLIWPLHKDGFRYRPKFGWRGYGFGDVSRMTMWTFTLVLTSALQGSALVWVMSAMRAGAPHTAGVTTQQFAYSLTFLPVSLVMVSIVSALFPAMSSAWADADNDRMKGLVRQGLIMPSVLVIAPSMALIGLALPLVHVVYGSTGVDATNLWLVIAAYSLGNWGSALSRLKQRYYFAKQDGWTNFWLGLLPILVQAAVALPALFWLPGRYGVAILAAADTVGVVLAGVIFLLLMRRDMGDYGLGGIIWLWFKVTVASAVAAAAAWVVVWKTQDLAESRLFAVVVLLAGGVAFLLVFWAVAALLRIEAVTSLVGRAIARVLRRPVEAPSGEATSEVTMVLTPVSGGDQLPMSASFEPALMLHLTPPPQPQRPATPLPPKRGEGLAPPPQPLSPSQLVASLNLKPPPRPGLSAPGPTSSEAAPTPPPQPWSTPKTGAGV